MENSTATSQQNEKKMQPEKEGGIMAMTDEKIITALALCGSVSATAVQLGVAESTIYRRLQDNEFRAKLEIVKGDVLRAFKANYLESSERARAAIESMMDNDKINPAIRLQACQTIINTAVKFVELSERAEDRALRAKEYEREHRSDEWEDKIDSLFNIG